MRSSTLLRLGAMTVLLAASGCIEASPFETKSNKERAAAGSSRQADSAGPRVATAPSHGYNDAIAWRHLDEGLAESKSAGRPMMLLVHASWCPRCKELKPKFHEERLASLSQHFVMVNVDQDETPAVLGYGPDGTYLPRILFFDPDTGSPDRALQNPTRERFHYYYGPGDDLEGMMEKALTRHGNES